MVAMLPLVFIAAAAKSAIAAPATLSVQWLDDIDSDAVCNDGSKGGFYFRPATSEALKTQWLVYLPPHHWCYDNASCAERYATDLGMMSSKEWHQSVLLDGIFAEGPMAGANLVQLGYCSSDIYLGDVAASNATWGWHFRGERIVRATFTKLKAHFGLGSVAGTTVVLGGASAGARGALVWLDHLKTLVPRGVRRFGFLDTPHPFHHLPAFLPTGPTGDYTALNTQTIVEMLSPGINKFMIPEACPERSERWKCLFAEFRLPHLTEDYVLVAPRFGHEMESDLSVTDAQLATLSSDQLDYAQEWGLDVKRALHYLTNASVPGKRVLYSPACFQPHVQSATSNFYAGGQGVNRTTQQEALQQLLNDSAASQIYEYEDTCSTFNCGPMCDPLPSTLRYLV